MNDSDYIPQSDIILVLPDYKGEYGWPTFGDFKQYLPDYFWSCQVKQGGWEPWDNPNKSSIILLWHGRRVSIEAQEKWLAESNEVSRRIAEEERKKRELEEQKRLERVAKFEQETQRRSAGAAIVAQQVECSARKQVDKLIDEANELVSNAGKLVAVLRRIPANRLHEVDLDSFLFNAGRVTKINEASRPGQLMAPID